MSDLMRYAVRRDAPLRATRQGARADIRVPLNLPDFDGGAHVRAFVEDTSAHRVRRRRMPSPRLKLRIADCTSRIHLEFSVNSSELRENSLHKIDTLVAELVAFRAGLVAEAELRASRERAGKEARCRT